MCAFHFSVQRLLDMGMKVGRRPSFAKTTRGFNLLQSFKLTHNPNIQYYYQTRDRSLPGLVRNQVRDLFKKVIGFLLAFSQRLIHQHHSAFFTFSTCASMMTAWQEEGVRESNIKYKIEIWKSLRDLLLQKLPEDCSQLTLSCNLACSAPRTLSQPLEKIDPPRFGRRW